jgi:hypothetical protein
MIPSESSLLATSAHDWFKTDTWPSAYIQCTYALRAIDLMTTQAVVVVVVVVVVVA